MLPALGSMALAQTAPAPATSAAAPDASNDVVVLNAFTVSTDKDSGYRASNSIAGTRTNTPIKDIPLNIQVFTKDLADDLLIKNQVDFEAYNAALVNGGADPFTDNVIQQANDAGVPSVESPYLFNDCPLHRCKIDKLVDKINQFRIKQ